MPLSDSDARPSYWDLLARKIEQHPALLDNVVITIDRWLAADHSAPERLREWRHLAVAARSHPAGLQQLLHTLTSSAPADQRLREFSPFAGILTREERRQARELCSYRH